MKKKLSKAISILTQNPKIFFKRLICLMMNRWFLPRNNIVKSTNGVRFYYDFELDSAVNKMYHRCYEIEVEEVMRKVLKPGDVFIDIGANIGYFSAIGAGCVGTKGQVHSFEPVPQYFKLLKNMCELNPDYKIVVNNCAVGENEGTADIKVTKIQNIGFNTMVPGGMKEEKVKETLQVPVCNLSNYIEKKELNNIALIKIDTEGYEFPILKGLNDYLVNSKFRPVIICEIDPSSLALLGYTGKQMVEYMNKFHYTAYSLLNTSMKVDITRLKETGDVVFIVS